MSAEFDFMTATELRQRIARREISPVALTRRALDKAAATQASLNAFFLLMPERALDAAREAEEAVLGCIVEQVDSVFEKDPADLWTAEFYAGVGTRLRGFVEKQRDLLDPAVAEVLEAAVGQDMRGYYEKVFERYAFRDKVRAFFADYDLLVSPVLPVPSLDVAKNIPDHLSDRNLVSWVYYTYPFNLTGQPVATVCAGVGSDGMPIGLQIVGKALGEHDVVRAAAAFERAQLAGYNLAPAARAGDIRV
jgi:aspartyl-tRNA(Asn)/glutamyl-tRNA(Gln) amidotransferase subunit A